MLKMLYVLFTKCFIPPPFLPPQNPVPLPLCYSAQRDLFLENLKVVTFCFVFSQDIDTYISLEGESERDREGVTKFTH